MARPSSFKPEYVEQAMKLAKLGATDTQLADFFDVAVTTIYNWKTKYPEFLEALNLSKDEADQIVEKSLYQRALGYEHDETDIRVVGGEIVQTKLRKYYPPDTTACIFWLKNRKPEQWREMKAIELTGANGGAVQTESKLDVGSLPTDVLAQIMAAKDAANKG